MNTSYDAILIVSFGGPEAREDVMPFLENVVKGRNVPRERLENVAEHYYLFDGVSPINQQNRLLIRELEILLAGSGPQLPVYWGNRNWHPLLSDTIGKMAADGITSALAFVTSAFGSFSSCRQYLDNIQQARTAVGTGAPAVQKLRLYFNHPGFITANADRLRLAIESLGNSQTEKMRVLFSAHSIPLSMVENCMYKQQLLESCRLVANRLGLEEWDLVFQSRSGPPNQPWLEPDVLEEIERLAGAGFTDIIVHPIGFVSDHMEVVYDLDTEAAQLANRLAVNLIRSQTVGSHPAFVEMIRSLILEKVENQPAEHEGELGLLPEQCAVDCCRK